MRITPMKSPELHHPGWQVVDWRGYEYTLFAPDPTADGRDVWRAHWRDAESDDGGLTTHPDVDKVLITFPIRVVAALRPLVDEHLSGTGTNKEE